MWVVDNASSDGSAEMVRERFGWVELVASQDNLGFGAAVNLVAERSESEWIAPANADVAPEPGALAALLAAGRARPRAGAIAPRLLLPDGSTQHSVNPFPTLGVSLVFNLGLHAVLPGLGDRLCLPGKWNPERPRDVDWAVGALLLVRREAWSAAGGFDPRQWMYAEDVDLGWRLRRAGWNTFYEPTARVLHAESAAAASAWGAARRDRSMAASYEWMRRRRGGAVTRATAGLNLAGAAARALALTVLARLAPARWAWPRDEARAWTRGHLKGLRDGGRP